MSVLTYVLPARRSALGALALAGALTLTGCAGGSSSDSTAATAPGSTASQAAWSPADVAFVQGMLPHHVQAVEMADLVLTRDPSPAVRDLAERIKAAQSPEIEQLEAMLATFGASAGAGHSRGSGHGSGGMSGMSGGMMSPEDMMDLKAATGTQAERMFLAGMIEHHRGAVEMAEVELSEGRYPEALELARAIKAAQQGEIEEMERLLAAL